MKRSLIEMTSKDELKGKAKEAYGKLVDDDKKKSEGKTDQVKGKVNEAKDSVKDSLEGVKESLSSDDKDD